MFKNATMPPLGKQPDLADFLEASMQISGPSLVPPFQNISLNLTTTAESLLHYQALCRKHWLELCLK